MASIGSPGTRCSMLKTTSDASTSTGNACRSRRPTNSISIASSSSRPAVRQVLLFRRSDVAECGVDQPVVHHLQSTGNKEG